MKIKFDLKQPCKDCPFKKSTPKHKGIASSLIEYSGFIDQGTFAHTCHKTDKRADSPEGRKFKGTPRHCAGALILMRNDPQCMSNYIAARSQIGLIDLNKIKDTGVYKSFKEMALDYYRWIKDGMPNELSNQIQLNNPEIYLEKDNKN